MVKFVIIRHGYSVYNKERRFTGQCDVDLDSAGLEQAQDTAKYVVENYAIDKIYSSDLKRAVDTATPIAKALNLPINTLKGLREIDVGDWEGLTFEQVRELYPKEFEHYITDVGNAYCVGGESYADLVKRANETMRRLAKENDGKTLLVSTHGGFIRCLRCAWLNLSLGEIKNIPHVGNASVTVVEFDGESANFTLIGYDGHIKNKVSESRVSDIKTTTQSSAE